MVNTFTITQEPSASDFFVYPNADVAGCTEHTPYGDTTNNYPNIDDLKDAPNDDTDYNYNDTANLYIDLFDLPNTVKTGAINYVQVFARAKSHEFPQAPSGIYKLAVSPSSTCTDYYLSSDIDLITSYTTYSRIWTVNPLTSAAWLWSVFATDMAIGYQSSSPQITFDKIATFRPNAHGTYCGLEGHLCPNCPGEAGAGDHWLCITEFDSKYASTVNLENGCPGVNNAAATDTFDMPDHTTETGAISKVVIVAKMAKSGTINDCGRIVAVPSDGATYEYATWNLPLITTGWGTFTRTLTTHPTTGLPWTWWDIDGLEIGYKLHVRCNIAPPEVAFRSYCNQIYLLVYYVEPDNPEIRTTQCYMKVNYAPPTDTCYLNKPNQISTNHSRNIKMINFWSGNREVYDLNRSGKSMMLTGTEFYHPDATDLCARIECIRQMGLADVEVSITDLGNILWNGTYFIRSFSWKHMQGCPDWYEWMLDLEDTRHAEVGDGYG